jgi:hypothetical protein
MYERMKRKIIRLTIKKDRTLEAQRERIITEKEMWLLLD